MADQDKPQVTASSNSNEPSGNLEHTAGTGFGRRVPSKTRTLDDGSAVIVQDDNAEACPETVREPLEHAFEEVRSKEVETITDSKSSPVPDGKSHDHAAIGLFELLGLMFGLPPAEALYHGNPIDFRMLCFVAVGCFFAGLGTAWPAVRKKFPQQALVLSVGRMASDARYWLVVILAGFLYAAAPEIYRRATTPVAVTGAIEVMPIGSASLEDAIKAATAKIGEERDSALSNLARVSKERDDLAQQLQQSQKSSSPTASDIRKMGPIAVLNAFAESGAIWRKAVPANTGILITAPPENRELASNLSSIFLVGMREVSDKLKPGQPMLVQPPDYSIDIDAPRLPSSGYSGVVIHGSGEAQSELRMFLDRCFVTRQTPKTTEGLANYYKLDNVLWIEIGSGSPWKPDPITCSG